MSKNLYTKRLGKGNRLLLFPEDYIVIDTETTGFSPRNDKIIEIAALKVQKGGIIETFQTFVNPGIAIPEFISNLTGIRNEDVVNAPNITEALISFFNFIGESDLVAHNAHFDINFLYDNSMAAFEEPFRNDFVDTLYESRKYIKNLPNYRLATIADSLGIKYKTLHRALDDCHITNNLYKYIKNLKRQEIGRAHV